MGVFLKRLVGNALVEFVNHTVVGVDRPVGIADTAQSCQGLKPNTACQVLTAADVTGVVVVTLVVFILLL